jgi:hypothetical protein
VGVDTSGAEGRAQDEQGSFFIQIADPQFGMSPRTLASPRKLLTWNEDPYRLHPAFIVITCGQIGLMVYTFARVGAATSMKVEDFFVQGRRGWVRLHEKGSKEHEMPAHHNLPQCNVIPPFVA